MLTRLLSAPLAHRAVIHNDTIYLAGLVADDKSLPVRGQTTQILQKLDAILRTMNSDASNLLAVTNYLIDIGDKDEMNAAWAEFFDAQDFPARATVGVAQLGPGTLIEIVATAAAAKQA